MTCAFGLFALQVWERIIGYICTIPLESPTQEGELLSSGFANYDNCWVDDEELDAMQLGPQSELATLHCAMGYKRSKSCTTVPNFAHCLCNRQLHRSFQMETRFPLDAFLLSVQRRSVS